jgi:nicotinate-nucleotide pyrophosphorylase (carboxylating)
MRPAPVPPGERHSSPQDAAVALSRLIELALLEDLGTLGDVTSRLTVPPGTRARGVFVARGAGVLYGLGVVEQVFRRVDDAISLAFRKSDGDPLEAGDVIGEVDGAAWTLLAVERTALYFLQRLSGIATQTRRFVERLEGTGVRLLDTRKTTPGWRALEKAAVRAGGGHNHRHGLNDMILIKDNHIVAAGGILPALAAAKSEGPEGMPIEIEVARLEDLEAAIVGEPDGILLDNMTPDQVRAAVGRIRKLAGGGPWIEISGGITLETIRDYGLPGVDFISSGSLTHSAPALDIALDFLPEGT